MCQVGICNVAPVGEIVQPSQSRVLPSSDAEQYKPSFCYSTHNLKQVNTMPGGLVRRIFHCIYLVDESELDVIAVTFWTAGLTVPLVTVPVYRSHMQRQQVAHLIDCHIGFGAVASLDTMVASTFATFRYALQVGCPSRPPLVQPIAPATS